MARSIHIESNGLGEVCREEGGKPLNGMILTGDGFIHRFKDGLLDGDFLLKNGQLAALPAVEGPGYLEWRRRGRLHRDDDLPAVITDGFTHREWYVEGELIREE